MAYILEQFGTVSLPTYEAASDIGAGPAQGAFLALPGGGQFDVLGNDQAPRKGDKIMDRFTLVGTNGSDLETKYRNLLALTGKRDKLYRRSIGTSAQEWCYARLVNARVQRQVKDIFTLVMALEFQMISPLWNGTVHADTTTLNVSPKTFTITNNGNAIVEDSIITVTAGSLAITALTVKKKVAATAYGHLVFSSTIGAGQGLVIDCGARSVKLNGVDAYANFSLGAEHKNDAWIRLGPGANTIEVTFTGGATNSTCKFDFYDGWQ